ncbi:unnamed protein product [Parnassius mnemosyne]|uniref:Integrase catalytic domain-containing protein n=1 Tax=Parnassius mnemosyne TaxID=213953 RepID=A0AAV1KRG7_9NEOP
MKSKLYKAFSLQGNYNWIGDTLNNVIYEYNHTYHQTIGEIPANVNNKSKKRKNVKNDNEKRLSSSENSWIDKSNIL